MHNTLDCLTYARHVAQGSQHLHLCNTVSKLLQVHYAGALVQTVEQDDRLDSAVVSFLVLAQERIMVVLMPPGDGSPQPLTLALLQARIIA